MTPRLFSLFNKFHDYSRPGKTKTTFHDFSRSSGGTSINILGEKGGQEFFLGGKNVKMCVKYAKICHFMLNGQIWANFNTFEIILGGKLGGGKKIFWGKIPPCLLWCRHCPGRGHPVKPIQWLHAHSYTFLAICIQTFINCTYQW